jgi:DNA mismatch endonuclease (patch repair protein)
MRRKPMQTISTPKSKSTSSGASSRPSTTSRRRKRKKKTEAEPIDPRRSALMARVRQRHSEPEQAVRRILRVLGIPFRLLSKQLPGTPDIVVPSRNCVIFVHGCFWHRHDDCPKATTPKTRVAFWSDKFARNVARDARKARQLRKLGWRLLTVWECQCRDVDKLTRRLERTLAHPAGGRVIARD